GRWRSPVEDQNDTKPPKYVVDELFRRYRTRPAYTDTVDAVWILERASLSAVEAACPQRFAPFVCELRALAEKRDRDARAVVHEKEPRENQTQKAVEEATGDEQETTGDG